MTVETLDVVQGSDEWLDARTGLLTASVIGQLITAGGKLSTGATARTLLRRLGREQATGRSHPVTQTWQMRRGSELEEYARAEYEMEHTTKPVTETGLLVLTLNGGARLGYSPDGLVSGDGLLEIKCPNIDRYTDVVLDDAPLPEHVAQLQAGLFVTGRAWIDYMVFHPGEPSHVVRVFPDPTMFALIDHVTRHANEEITAYAHAFTTRTKGHTPSPAELDEPYQQKEHPSS